MDWLTLLALLACPLMMIFCMKGMRGHHDCPTSSEETSTLKRQILELKKQNEQLRKEMQLMQSVMKDAEKAHPKTENTIREGENG